MENSDDDVHHCLVSVFAELDTPGKQRKALNSLFESLSHSQIRESIASLRSTDFTYDIVGGLPLEINIIIFQHLPIRQVFLAHRVSREWLRILSSPAILDPLLHQWYSMGKTPLRIPEGLDLQAIKSLEAEHIDAYRRGLAFSKAAYTWDLQSNPNPAGIAYADGRVAWINKTGVILSVLNLERGSKQSFIPPNRERMISITVSTNILAATTFSGRCYVWELRNGDTHFFRLISISRNSLISSRKTLAILHRSNSPPGDCVTTWNLETLRSYRFPATARQIVAQDVDEREPLVKKKIMLSNNGQSVIIFEKVSGYPERNYFKRLSLDGRIQASGSLDVHTAFNYVKSPEDRQPLSSARFPTIWSYSPPYRSLTSRNLASKDGDDETSDLLRVLYDPERECLRLEHHSPRIIQNIFQNESICRNIGHDHQMDYTEDFFFWKDVAYYRASSSEAGLKVIDLKTDTCSVADMDWYTSEDFERFNDCEEIRDGNGQPILQPLLFGDETYLVNVFAGGFVAWCFDKDITMANEDEGYRLFRGNAIQKKV